MLSLKYTALCSVCVMLYVILFQKQRTYCVGICDRDGDHPKVNNKICNNRALSKLSACFCLIAYWAVTVSSAKKTNAFPNIILCGKLSRCKSLQEKKIAKKKEYNNIQKILIQKVSNSRKFAFC